MKVNASSFRLTFNLPAENYFFEGEDITGMQIKIENDVIFFRPVRTEDQGSPSFDDGLIGEVSLIPRPRGGKEAVIEGDQSDELMRVLCKDASLKFPFFIVKRARGEQSGWITIEHFGEPDSPPKFTPHMRVWFPRNRIENGFKAPLNDDIKEVLGDFVDTVRGAREVIAHYESDRRIGRPPREVLESRIILDNFRDLVNEVMPNSNIAEIVQPVQAATAMLVEFIKTYGTDEALMGDVKPTTIHTFIERGPPKIEKPIIDGKSISRKVVPKKRGEQQQRKVRRA